MRCSPQQWVRWWDPPETGTVVMMVREGGGARQVEEKGADNAAEPLEDLLKAAAEDAAANPRLYHGTTLDAGDDKEHGFSLENASPQGDLGEIRMVYFSKVSRFAAAWAILKTVSSLQTHLCFPAWTDLVYSAPVELGQAWTG